MSSPATPAGSQKIHERCGRIVISCGNKQALPLLRRGRVDPDQFLILLMDEERAVAALPKLLPENRRERETGLAAVRRIVTARGPLPAEGSRRLARIEALFESPPSPAGSERELEIVEE